MRHLFFFLTILFFDLTASPDFVVFTQPHTGTHLLVPLLEELTGKEGLWPFQYFTPDSSCDEETFEYLAEDPEYLAFLWNKTPTPKKQFSRALIHLKNRNQFLFLHAPYTPNMEAFLAENGYKVFTIDRDPRDTCISALLHCRKFGTGLIDGPWFHEMSFNDQLEMIITGTDWTNSARHLSCAFMNWHFSPISCNVNFSRLLGPMGGGASVDEQIQELRKIARFLEIDVSDERLIEAFYSVYGKGHTFHKGNVGMWEDYFNSDNKWLFKDQMADILIKLGYEEDRYW
ncbi:MAG: hypothetical protein K940chlam3_00925 [Chlamydiae bacterium]|nr:hypothetical protein [Chlamydiota bacterium]